MPTEKCPFEIFASTKKWASLRNCLAPGLKILTSTIGGSEVAVTGRTPDYLQSYLLSFTYEYIQSFRSGAKSRTHAGQLEERVFKSCYCYLRQFHYVPLADL